MKKDSITDLTANEIDLKVNDILKHYEVGPILPHLTGLSPAHLETEVKNGRGDNKYYQWLACLVRLMKPKQVVELGAASGISTIMMLTEMDKDSVLYSVDNDPQIAWKWMNRDYSQLVKILSDDLDMTIWKDIDLGRTDLWFIDTLHYAYQLKRELELYGPYFKKGSIVVLDDIRTNDMYPVWESIEYDKCENTNPNHYSGFGFFKV